MLYATTSQGDSISGHKYDRILENQLNIKYKQIAKIQADGHELEKCCEILGRNLPKRRVYTFLGNNAQEIALNWDSK